MKLSLRPTKETKPSLILLILANLVPLYMVLYEGWSVGEILMVFWLENVVIGIYNVLRMISCGQKHAGYSKPFIIPFFIFHYGMFTLGHGAIINEFFVEKDRQQLEESVDEAEHYSTDKDSTLKTREQKQTDRQKKRDEPPFGPEMVPYFIEKLNLWWPFLALMASHGFSFVWHYLRGGEYRNSKVGELMGRPYGRVILLHITVLIGGLLVEAVGAPIIALVLLITMKIFIDSVIHLNSHQGDAT